MARAQLGVTPANPTDEVILSWVRREYPSYSTNIEAHSDFTLAFPSDVESGQMQLF